LLVERAIKWLNAAPERRTVADVGTGSGCIAIAIAKNISDAKIIATDISLPACKLPIEMPASTTLRDGSISSNVTCCRPTPSPLPTDLHFDLICANLPYIPSQTLHSCPFTGASRPWR
jgi:release factor glutamine methyltransferase